MAKGRPRSGLTLPNNEPKPWLDPTIFSVNILYFVLGTLRNNLKIAMWVSCGGWMHKGYQKPR